MDTKEIVKSGKFKIAAGVVGVLLVIFISFAGGVAVGLHKAKFSYQWGQNYERNFMGFGPGGGPMMGNNDNHGGMLNLPRDIEGRGFRNAHGLAGTIVSISGNNLIVKDRDNKENTIVVSDKTIIKDRATDLKIADLKANEQIVVMGTPNNDQGVVNADLIRVFPNNPNIVGSNNNSNTDNTSNNN